MELEAASRDHLRESRLNSTGYTASLTGQKADVTPVAQAGGVHFNPIEKAFSKLKALLRKASERTVEGLWNAIGAMISQFAPQECANYFTAAGYDAI